MSDAELQHHGVKVIDRRPLTLQCLTCAGDWTPQPDVDGRLPSDYWLCPAQCNG
jgi:hypothetical protein